MSGSTYGDRFRITTWGESHGSAVGVVIDGCPAGLSLNEEIIQSYLNRRKPGASRYATPRKEEDRVEILSGLFEGRTTGTPVSLLIRNNTQRSGDYSEIAGYYRPGHADYTYDAKYGFRDYRGGGRSSGRETIGRVAAGAVASELLKALGIQVTAYTQSIGDISIDYRSCLLEQIEKSPLRMPDPEASKRAEEYLDELMRRQESAGGIIECIISGVPAGIGEPVFHKLDACLSKAILSIGAVKGVEFGSGFPMAKMSGSESNDSFYWTENGTLSKKTNHAGGILGGISDGSEIVFRAAIKPTPSVGAPQETANQAGENISVQIRGRHDPVIVPRAVVVVEAMAAITLTDLLFCSMTSRMDQVISFFRR